MLSSSFIVLFESILSVFRLEKLWKRTLLIVGIAPKLIIYHCTTSGRRNLSKFWILMACVSDCAILCATITYANSRQRHVEAWSVHVFSTLLFSDYSSIPFCELVPELFNNSSSLKLSNCTITVAKFWRNFLPSPLRPPSCPWTF